MSVEYKGLHAQNGVCRNLACLYTVMIIKRSVHWAKWLGNDDVKVVELSIKVSVQLYWSFEKAATLVFIH